MTEFGTLQMVPRYPIPWVAPRCHRGRCKFQYDLLRKMLLGYPIPDKCETSYETSPSRLLCVFKLVRFIKHVSLVFSYIGPR